MANVQQNSIAELPTCKPAGSPPNLFSVVVPLYNKKPYIRRCVESVLQQTFKKFELLVVDDGSTDRGVLELTGIEDPRLGILRQENQGVAAARNAGVARTKGEWIAFLDADDFWLVNHLQELDKIIASNCDAGLVATGHVERTADQEFPLVTHEFCRIATLDYFSEAAKKMGVVCSSTAAVRRSAFNTVGGFENFRPGQDRRLWSRIALDFPVAVSSKVTAVYCRGTGGVIESMANVTSRKPGKLTLADVTPDVALLAGCFEEKKYQNKRNSIVAYLNSRVHGSIRGALYRGNVHEARSLSKLFISPRLFRFRILSYVFLLPDVCIEMMLVLFRARKLLWKKNSKLTVLE